MAYNHSEIENKWQKKWAEAECFKSTIDKTKPKFYALDMFPYPSGKGLHVGHIASYTPTDIIARFKRTKGFNVLHPMGYDAFGLPAEQYAIQTGVPPQKTTDESIENFKSTLKSYGYSFDWSREISTCDAHFYKWTQFIFLKLFERGLAYQKEVPVNWCPALRTVLANEEVTDGKSERGQHPVVRIPMKQWMLKITDYAERLLNDLDKVDWPERTKEGQRHWIGKSEGATIRFDLDNHKVQLEVFTTRPDTIFGVTFMVLAPEHPLIEQITTPEQKKCVEAYIQTTQRKSEIDRKSNLDKTGEFTGAYAINPVNKQKIPIWIADYVLMDYGSGAIMAVPGGDERDFEFAQKFDLPIRQIIEGDSNKPCLDDGPHINSEFLNGLLKNDATKKMIQFLEEHKYGEKKTTYKLRDWLFSRQRYWGEPFPIVHYNNGETRGVDPNELPVTLPSVADYQPSEKGEPPLARNKEWVNYINSLTKEEGIRETDTMPGSAGSSWYFLRYTDPKNNESPFGFEEQKYWMPVDLYVGGAEHTVGHLLYARFWQKVLFDAGLVSHDEPFLKLAHQGIVMGPDGQKMSKSRGNVINPDEVQNQYGSDAARVYISFLGPFDKDKPWDTKNIEGIKRFLDRVWRLSFNDENQVIADDNVNVSDSLLKTFHKTIKKVEEDIGSLNFNTAISAMMILVNEIYKEKVRPKFIVKTLAQLLMPFAPHMSEEIWQALGGDGFVSLAPFPQFDPKLIVDDKVKMGVQVSGKMRGTIEIATDASEEKAIELANELVSVKNSLDGKNILKVIYKPGKILNIIAK